MARKFDVTNIIDPAKAPLTKRSLTHLNSAYDELTKQMIESSFVVPYTTNDIVILSGCEVTANIPGTSEVTAGQIYYNGRIYDVDANASISSPSNTLVWSIVESVVAGDPATFSDGNSYNFHIIEKFVLSNAVSGSGIADYNGATVKYKIATKRINIGAWNIDSEGVAIISHGLNFSKIISVELQLWSDDLTPRRFKNYRNSAGGASYACGFDSTNIYIYRDNTDDTGANWDDAVINRGYVYVTLGDI